MINSTSRYMAIAILAACKLWSDSYNQTGADAASAEEIRKREEWETTNPGRVYIGYGTNYGKFYTKTLEQCCEEACSAPAGPGVSNARLLYLALDGWWNDTLDWANKVLDPTGTTEFSSEYCQHGVKYSETIDTSLEEKPVEIDDWHCQLCKELYLKTKG